MNYSNGVEVHLHDIVVVDYVKTNHCFDGRAGSWTESTPHHELGKVVDVFPNYKKCFLISILSNKENGKTIEVRAKKPQVKLADYRDLHLLDSKKCFG